MVLMAVTALPLCASLPRSDYLASQVSKVTAEGVPSLPALEQDASAESSHLCASAPLREKEKLLPGMDRRIGFAETVGGTTTFYYYLTDHVGTVLRIVTESGTVNQYDYDAFGRVRSSSEGVENRYLFQGRGGRGVVDPHSTFKIASGRRIC